MLVLKHTVQHQELLAATMRMRSEPAVWAVAHDGGRARHFIADAVEHSPVHPRNGDGVQSSRAAWTAARALKSELRFMPGLRLWRSLGKERASRPLGDRLSAASVSKPAAIGDRHHDQGFVRPGRAGHRHSDRVEVREWPGVVPVSERHMRARAGCGDLHLDDMTALPRPIADRPPLPASA